MFARIAVFVAATCLICGPQVNNNTVAAPPNPLFDQLREKALVYVEAKVVAVRLTGDIGKSARPVFGDYGVVKVTEEAVEFKCEILSVQKDTVALHPKGRFTISTRVDRRSRLTDLPLVAGSRFNLFVSAPELERCLKTKAPPTGDILRSDLWMTATVVMKEFAYRKRIQLAIEGLPPEKKLAFPHQ